MGIIFVQWEERYSVGFELIDQQHKHLLELTNMLYEWCRRGEVIAREHFAEILHATVDYVGVHFSTEERLMDKVNYPDKVEHKGQHAFFAKKIMEARNDFEEGKSGVAVDFVHFLKDWILSHIAVCDKTFVEYFNRTIKERASQQQS